MHYRVHSTKLKVRGWYPTRTEVIAAFERASKRAGIQPSREAVWESGSAFIAFSTAKELERMEA